MGISDDTMQKQTFFTFTRMLLAIGMLIIVSSAFLVWQKNYWWNGFLGIGHYNISSEKGFETPVGLISAGLGFIGLILVFAVNNEKTAHSICSFVAVLVIVLAIYHIGKANWYGNYNSTWNHYSSYGKAGEGIYLSIVGALIVFGGYFAKLNGSRDNKVIIQKQEVHSPNQEIKPEKTPTQKELQDTTSDAEINPSDLTDGLLYHCAYCDTPFKSKDEAYSHIARLHTDKPNQVIEKRKEKRSEYLPKPNEQLTSPSTYAYIILKLLSTFFYTIALIEFIGLFINYSLTGIPYSFSVLLLIGRFFGWLFSKLANKTKIATPHRSLKTEKSSNLDSKNKKSNAITIDNISETQSTESESSREVSLEDNVENNSCSTNLVEIPSEVAFSNSIVTESTPEVNNPLETPNPIVNDENTQTNNNPVSRSAYVAEAQITKPRPKIHTQEQVVQRSKISFAPILVAILFIGLCLYIGFVFILQKSIVTISNLAKGINRTPTLAALTNPTIAVTNPAINELSTSVAATIIADMTKTQATILPMENATETVTPEFSTSTPAIANTYTPVHEKNPLYYPIEGCAASRLYKNDLATLTSGTERIAIRNTPDTHPSDNIIGRIYPGDIVQIIGGPACNYGWVLWKIRAQNGLVGWATETNGNEFWLEGSNE